MNNKLTTCQLVLLGTLVLAIGCWCDPKTNGSLPRSLVTVEGRILPVFCFPDLLKEMLHTVHINDKYDNFILFIHGRGRHPTKAFRKKLIADLESNYSAKVIMFHWPSWNGPMGFPEQAARSSAEDLIKILYAIKAFKEDYRDMTEGIKFTLLTHSMGSLVLEESILTVPEQTLGPLFDTVVISASASSTRNHSEWINRMKLSHHIYITVNRNDPVLGSAGMKKMEQRLGKGLTSQGQEVTLSNQALYIDVTTTGVFHRYFLHCKLKRAPSLKAFFNQVLNGYPATLILGDNVKEVSRQRVYVLKDSHVVRNSDVIVRIQKEASKGVMRSLKIHSLLK